VQKVNYPSETKLTLKIDSFENGLNTKLDEHLTNINYSTNLYNFAFLDGALKNGIGFNELINSFCSEEESKLILEDFETIGSIEKIFHFYIYNNETNVRDDKLIFINYEHKFFYVNLYASNKNLLQLRNVKFIRTPNAVRYRLNGEDVMIFTSEEDNMLVWNGYDEPYTVLDAPKISSMTLHYERLFATVNGEKNSVWFSDDLDPTNWNLSLNEAGFIDLVDERGALLKVISFCDYVYIFREHGISRLSAYGNQENFSVSNLFVSSGEIYADSVCVCGDEIIFLASDGLYKFDGVNTIKILENITKNLENIKYQSVSSCFYNGSYYLACKFNFFDDTDSCNNRFYSNALLEIDVNSHKIKNITHGVNIKFITSFSSNKIDGVIALSSLSELEKYTPTILTNSGCYLDKPLKKIWQSPKSGINDIYKFKTLKKVRVQTLGNVKVYVYHDNHESVFNFNGATTPQLKLTNLNLYSFGFKIESEDCDCDIKNLEFEFYSTDGRL